MRRALLPLLLLLAAASVSRLAAATPAEVWLLEVEGVINPLTTRYLTSGLDEAAAAGAAAVVVRLNTPGGLESAMREMTEAMLGAPVPVVVWVAPPGGRAASAGMFLTIAAHVAAMAPGTNIGAAHPVALGAPEDDVAAAKLVSDAAALARSIAAARGRNAEWAERAVRESASLSADEALAENVIDVVAADLPGLLAEIDGRTVVTRVGEVTLATAGARVVERPMSLPTRILHALANPNIAYLLMMLGFIGLVAELYNPGMLFPGVTGVISLVLAFVAFNSLPINWAAVLLLVLAIGLFVADLMTEGIGILAAGGLVAFVLGSLMLYDPFRPVSPAMPDVSVSPWLVGGMAALVAVFFLAVLRVLVRTHRRPATTGTRALVGRHGVAVTDLDPEGRVRIDTETWRAIAGAGRIAAGEPVEVVDVAGVTLTVKPRARHETGPAARVS